MTTPENDPMPVFVLKAKDMLALKIIDEYRRECIRYCFHDQAAEVTRAYAEMERWRLRHPELVKIPDHKHVPAGHDD